MFTQDREIQYWLIGKVRACVCLTTRKAYSLILLKEMEIKFTCMWSSHKVRPTRAAPADNFLKSAPQSLSATLCKEIVHKF